MSPNVQANVAWTLGKLSKDVVDNALKIGSYPGAMEKLVGLLAEEGRPSLQGNAALTLWYISCEVFENRSLLRTAFLKAPMAMEVLADLTSSEKHEDGSLQYWGARLYEIANIDNDGEKDVIRYKSSRAYVGQGDARLSVRDYTGALEAYENSLAIEFDDGILRYKL